MSYVLLYIQFSTNREYHRERLGCPTFRRGYFKIYYYFFFGFAFFICRSRFSFSEPTFVGNKAGCKVNTAEMCSGWRRWPSSPHNCSRVSQHVRHPFSWSSNDNNTVVSLLLHDHKSTWYYFSKTDGINIKER